MTIKKKNIINVNGIYLNADEKILPISNRGFKYGDGLFESMRFANGNLNFTELHVERLQAGMKGLKMEGYSQIDSYFLKEISQDICKRNRIASNARLRLNVYRQGEGLYAPDKNDFAYTLEATALDKPQYELNQKGLILDLYDEINKPINILSNYKTCNALIYVMAGIFKTQNKLDEAFILNQDGNVCESISANIFLVYQNTIYTPSLQEGCIAGVMRHVIIELAQENNLDVVETKISKEMLLNAEEIFLTNASKGIQWVLGYNTKRYFNATSKKLSALLNKKNDDFCVINYKSKN